MDKAVETSVTPRPPRRAPEPIFAFEDPVDYLNFELRARRKQDPRFSLRFWARQVGYENPSYLSQVLKRERRLKPELASRLAGTLELEGKQQRYFELMVLGQAAGQGRGKKGYQQLIRELRPRREQASNTISLELFTLVSDWYHYAITEMTQLKGFESNEAWIRRRLGNGVDVRTVREAIDRLVRLGFLVRSADGQLRRAPIGNYAFDPDTPVEALRALHRKWIDLAKTALDEQSTEERDYYFSTMSFRRSDVPKVKEIMREAHRKVLALEATENGEDIYQLNTHFFRITKPERSKGTKQ